MMCDDDQTYHWWIVYSHVFGLKGKDPVDYYMYIYGDVYLNRHQEFAASGKLRFYFALCLWVQNKEEKKD